MNSSGGRNVRFRKYKFKLENRTLRTILIFSLFMIGTLVAPFTVASPIDFSCINSINIQMANPGACTGEGFYQYLINNGYDNSGNVVLNIYCHRPPPYIGDSGSGGCSYNIGDLMPQPKTQRIDCPAQQSGSIINVDTLSIGEALPVRGTPFTLSYSSAEVAGQIGDYTVTIPVTDATPDPSVLSYKLVISDTHGTQTFNYSAAPNISYTYVWDGKDASGNLVAASGSVSPYQLGQIVIPITWEK